MSSHGAPCEPRGSPACSLELEPMRMMQLASVGTPGDRMNARKLIAVLLIIAGTLGLIYRGFSYSRETHEAKLGNLELSVAHRSWVDVPVWASVGAIVIGAGLLVTAPKP